MTDEQINVAIAEACGWAFHEGTEPCYGGTYKRRGWSDGKTWRINPPSYATDLNAMHEAERTLTIESFASYETFLCSAVDSSGKDPDIWFYVLTSTACQRAEAFLRTIGKWIE